MALTIASLAQDVEAVVSGSDSERRISTLRQITNLFADQAPRLTADHIGAFDEVIHRLARNIEFRARVELAERLADIDNSPPRVVRSLAFDEDVEVAKPVLERSSLLSEEDLAEVAGSRGQGHLLALSRRPILTERVTTILVDRGDETVVRSVAGNDGARFSEASYTQLVARAAGDPVLQDTLERRSDISEKQMQNLLAIARERARGELVGEMGAHADGAIEAAVEEASARLAEVDVKSVNSDFAEALARLEGEMTQPKLMSLIANGRDDDLIVGISRLTGIGPELVSRAFHAASYDPLLFIFRASNLGWPTFKAMLMRKAGRIPPIEILKGAFESYQKVSVATAQRVVRFTAARDAASKSAA